MTRPRRTMQINKQKLDIIYLSSLQPVLKHCLLFYRLLVLEFLPCQEPEITCLCLSLSDHLSDSVWNSCIQTLYRRDNAKPEMRCTHNNIIGVDNECRILLILVRQACGKLWACWIIKCDRTDSSVSVLSVSFFRSVNALSADSYIPGQRLSRCTLYHQSKVHQQTVRENIRNADIILNHLS